MRHRARKKIERRKRAKGRRKGGAQKEKAHKEREKEVRKKKERFRRRGQWKRADCENRLAEKLAVAEEERDQFHGASDALAQDAADTDAEGMVLLGKGFALLSIGRAEDAVDALVACKRLSAANPAQECFVADLLAKAQGAARPQREEHTREGPEEREQPAAENDAKASAPGESRKNPFEDVVR